MEQEDNRPKWLLELENRKRKPRLAHEAGAGAPCLTCNSACPGLDLHFWRKICKNCKCSRDVHDVDEDEFPQFELLFGPSGKSRKRPMRLCINKKHLQSETTFEWVPPDTTKELATDYMKALPVDKQPIKGSIGAALRKQQLQKQLPLHDIDHKACDELNDQEKKEFEQYLENLKKFVGQGKVMKFMVARPFHRSLMTPANATDVQRSSPQHQSPLSSNQGVNLRTPSSFIPKSRSPILPRNNSLQATLSTLHTNVLESSSDVSSSPGRYHRALTKVNHDSDVAKASIVGRACLQQSSNLDRPLRNPSQTNTPSKADTLPNTFDANPNVPSTIQPSTETLQTADEVPLPSATVAYEMEKLSLQCGDISYEVSYENAMLAEKMLSEALLPPSAIHANDIVGSTLDEKKLSFIREQLNSKYGGKEDTMKLNSLDSNSHVSAITAKGIDFSKSKDTYPVRDQQYQPKSQQSISHGLVMDSTIPQEPLSENSERVPASFAHSIENGTKTGTKTGSRLPNVSCAEPLQAEFNGLRNVPLNVIHSEELKNPVFPEKIVGGSRPSELSVAVDHLQEDMEGVTVNATKVQKCHTCQENVNVGDVVVTAEKAKDAVWHPGCFSCSVCNELLADLVYFYYKGKLYCGRDLASLLEIPRCYACDELIFVRKYTVAEGHSYHLKHFCCWDCDIPLAGQQYTFENDRILCLPCYQNNYAKICNACNKAIAADHQGVAVKDLNFHATDECFCCFECRKSLLNSRMAIKENRPFCSKECISKFFNRKS